MGSTHFKTANTVVTKFLTVESLTERRFARAARFIVSYRMTTFIIVCVCVCARVTHVEPFQAWLRLKQSQRSNENTGKYTDRGALYTHIHKYKCKTQYVVVMFAGLL